MGTRQLATYAQAWAQHLADQDMGLVHRGDSANPADNAINNPFKLGEALCENLYGETVANSAQMGPAAVRAWISEKHFYNLSERPLPG